jgi:AcrR family transcriptional regulator
MSTSEIPSTVESAGPRRADARRNRERILVAAREAFAEGGESTALEQIARRAGVGIGTLYRHFPTRVDLVQAVFTDRLENLLATAERAAALPDAWAGFRLYVEAHCELQAEDRGFDDLAGIRLPNSSRIDAIQERILQLGVGIVEGAQRQGALRTDVTVEDLAFVIWSQGRVAQATRGIAPRAWRRHLHLILDAFRPDRASPLTEPPLTRDELYQAMVRLGGSGPCGSSEQASRDSGSE